MQDVIVVLLVIIIILLGGAHLLGMAFALLLALWAFRLVLATAGALLGTTAAEVDAAAGGVMAWWGRTLGDPVMRPRVLRRLPRLVGQSLFDVVAMSITFWTRAFPRMIEEGDDWVERTADVLMGLLIWLVLMVFYLIAAAWVWDVASS